MAPHDVTLEGLGEVVDIEERGEVSLEVMAGGRIDNAWLEADAGSTELGRFSVGPALFDVIWNFSQETLTRLKAPGERVDKALVTFAAFGLGAGVGGRVERRGQR